MCKNKFLKLFLIIFSAVLIFVIAGISFLFYFSKKILTPDFVSSFVKNTSKLELSIDKIDSGFKKGAFYLSTPHFELMADKDSIPIVEGDNFLFSFKAAPLLLGKIKVCELKSDKLFFNLNRNTDGSFDFAKYIKISSDPLFKLDLTSSKVNIGFYLFNFNDKLVKNNYTLVSHSFIADGLNLHKKTSIETNGEFIIESLQGKTTSSYLVDIDFSSTPHSFKFKKANILLSGLNTSFLKYYLADKKIYSTACDINLVLSGNDKNTLDLMLGADNLNIAFDYKGDRNTMISKNPLVIRSEIDFSENDLLLNDFKIISKNIGASFSGKIKNYLEKKNFEISGKVNLDNIFVADALELLPDTLIPFQEPYIKNLKFYQVNGIVNAAADIRFKNSEDFDVNGKLNFDDVYIKNRPKNARTSFLECQFKGRDVFLSVYAFAPKNAVLLVSGKSRMEKKPFGTFKIKSVGKLDMEFAQSILLPVQKILALKLGPIPYMKLKGEGEIDLLTAGTKEKANLKGYFLTDNATVSLNDLNALLTDGHAKIVFDGTNILFNGITGLINGSKTKIDGKSDTSGNINIDVNVNDIKASDALRIAKTSPIVINALDGAKFLNSFNPSSGNIDFKLNLSGNIPPDAVYGAPSDSVLAKGSILFKGVNILMAPKIIAANTKGVLNFATGTDFDLTSDIFGSPFIIKGKVFQKNSKGRILKGVNATLDLHLISDSVKSASIGQFINENIELFIPQNRLFALCLSKVFLNEKFTMKGNISALGDISPDSEELDLSKFNFDGVIQGNNTADTTTLFKSGNIILSGKNAKFNNLRFVIDNIDLHANGQVAGFVTDNPFNDLKFTFYKSPFEGYLKIARDIANERFKASLDNFREIKGDVSGSIKLYKDSIDGEFSPFGVSFIDSKSKMPFKFLKGKIRLKNDKTYLNSLDVLIDNMPLHLDGFAQTDGRVNPEFNIYFSTDLNDKIVDSVINPKLLYPILLTGEINLKGRILGKLDSYTTYLTAVFPQASDISVMGLNLGDSDTKREAVSKIKFSGHFANIDYIKYYKFVSDEFSKLRTADIVNVFGGIQLNKGNIIFSNLRFATPNPAPVRFLNVLFKKSVIKDGTFTSDLLLNGSVNNPDVRGRIILSDVLVPAYDSLIDKIDIKMNNKTGDASFIMHLFDTEFQISANFENDLKTPVVINKISLYSPSIQVNNLVRALSSFSKTSGTRADLSAPVTSGQFSLDDILIKKGVLNVDEMILNDTQTGAVSVNFSNSKQGVLSIDDYVLNIAGGNISGKGIYNFNTKDVNLDSSFTDCDANILSKAFLNAQGEIFGNANGKFKISIKDFDPSDYIQKINADAEFEILNGTMPKLGSIEYLLRASNFLKSGIFGLTLNNVVDLIAPYKHGDFNKISGTFLINDAKINNLKIYSQGDNLSTYTFGDYDILSGHATIEILGKLSKKVSNLLGPIGNASVVSVLNKVTNNKLDELMKTQLLKNISKIPFLNLNNDDYRLFNVKIDGKINTEGIVKSFNWLN